MRCPECLNIDCSKVIDSRNSIPNNLIFKRRRRECKLCGYRFTTYEILAENAELVKSVMKRTERMLSALNDLKEDAKAIIENLPKSQPWRN